MFFIHNNAIFLAQNCILLRENVLYSGLLNSNIYLKLHSIQTFISSYIQFKHLPQVIFNTHIALQIFENLYLKLYFILKGLNFFQVIPFNIISDRNTLLNLNVNLETLCFVQLAELKNISACYI
ncbi:unnamed protein product [Rotaria magnacalcarata]